MTTETIRDTRSDDGPAPLDPALLRVIRPSASRLAAAEESFTHLLHEDIGYLVRQLPGGGWGFCERTVRIALWVALVEGLTWLGSANQADGFPASGYVSVGHALVRVVRDMSGNSWTSATGSAWIGLFMWMRPHVQAAAGQVAAQHDAARRQDAAQQEAAQRQAFDHVARRGVAASADVSAVSGLLDDEDDDNAGPGYGQIMMGMTVSPRLLQQERQRRG